eukprot:jgi/Chlat1/1045/Chrsp110S01559
MSFLSGRGFAVEGSYFKEEDKLALARRRRLLQEKGLLPEESSPSSSSSSSLSFDESSCTTDVLPEVLAQRRLLSGGGGGGDGVSEAERRRVERAPPIPPRTSRGTTLRATPTLQMWELPQTPLGRGRWDLQMVEDTPSRPPPRPRAIPQSEHARRAALGRGVWMLTKAFTTATAVVTLGFGGAVILTAKVLDIHSLEDIPTRGKAALEPRIERLRDAVRPMSQQVSRWKEYAHLSEEQQRAVGADYARVLGAKSSPAASSHQQESASQH